MNDVPDRIAFLMKQDAKLTTLAAAARAYGINYETFKKIASHNSAERRNISLEDALKIAAYHGVSGGWLLFNEGGPDLFKGIKLEGKIGAGQENMIFEDPGNEDAIPMDIIGPDARAFEVDGESMRPLARHGDTVFVGPATRDIRSLVGEECVVFLEDGRRFFKVIESGTEPGRYTLTSHNAAPIPNVEIHSAGRLIAIRRRQSKPIRARKRV